MAGTLLVTGSVGIDTVETQQDKCENCLGGAATYFSLSAGLLSPVWLVAVVGEDFPQQFMQILESRQIDLSGLETRSGSKTFRWHGKYSQDMNSRETIAVQLNVLIEAGPQIPQHFGNSKYVFLANHDPAAQLEFLDQLAGPEVVVCDTMDLWIDTQRDNLLKVLGRADGLMINDDEARGLTGRDNLVTAGRSILELGVKFVVIKKGEHGSMLISKDDLFLLPAYPTEQVVDPTGAGDSFAGGLMGFLARQDSGLDPLKLRQGLVYATLVASFTVESFSVDGLLAADVKKLSARRDQFLAMIGGA